MRIFVFFPGGGDQLIDSIEVDWTDEIDGMRRRPCYLLKIRVSICNSPARDGGRQLQNLTGNQRSDIIENLAELLLQRQPQILKANAEDLKILNEMNTTKHGGVGPLRGRLTLTPSKLKSLSDGFQCFSRILLNKRHHKQLMKNTTLLFYS